MIKIRNEKFKLFKPVADGIVASSATIGYMLVCPSIIIDATDDENIIDVIRLHKSIELGDIKLLWGRPLFKLDSYILKMEFMNPMHKIFGIEFSLKKNFMLIDGIMQSQYFYLQTGKSGDKVSEKIKDDKILIALPDLHVKEKWNKLLRKVLIKKYKAKSFSKKELNSVVDDSIKEFRKIWDIEEKQTK